MDRDMEGRQIGRNVNETTRVFNEMKNMRFFKEKTHHLNIYLTTSGPVELI